MDKTIYGKILFRPKFGAGLSGFWLNLFKRLRWLPLPARSLHNDSAVLDIGCGNGKYLYYLSDRCRHIYGCDVVDLLDPKLTNRIHFFKGDFLNFMLDSNSIDFVIMKGVFYRLKEPLETLKKIYRILKPQGSLSVSIDFIQHPLPTEAVKNAFGFNFPEGMFYCYDQACFLRIMQKIGFQYVRTDCTIKNRILSKNDLFPSSSGAARKLNTLAKYLESRFSNIHPLITIHQMVFIKA